MAIYGKTSINSIMENKEAKSKQIKISFGKNLSELRKMRRFSQKDVAEKLGLPVSTYANWEQGRTEPSVYEIYNIIKVLEIDANDLFDI